MIYYVIGSLLILVGLYGFMKGFAPFMKKFGLIYLFGGVLLLTIPTLINLVDQYNK